MLLRRIAFRTHRPVLLRRSFNESSHTNSPPNTHTYVGICACGAMHDSAFYNRDMNRIMANEMKTVELKVLGITPKRITPKHARLFSTSNASMAGANDLKDYAFEMATSNIRYGKGVTREVGYDLKDIGAKLVCVFADPALAKLKDKDSPVHVVLESLRSIGIKFEVFSDISVEPTDSSFKRAIAFAASKPFDSFVAVGGGSTMDTAKAANLYSTHPPKDFLDYVNPPIGKGLPPPGPVKPLIAIPTTAGTGSETTGVAIFDYEEKHFKTGIAHRLLRPLLGIIDPNNTKNLPPNVIAASGFDVLCHSLESYTALPYDQRGPRPATPKERPAYQGANPISDFWSLKALELTSAYLPRSFRDPNDEEARSQMLLAATYAGIGFGNGGVHLCVQHGMSYPVSGNAHELKYKPKDYPSDRPMVPHGISVVLHAPAVFRFTASANPGRHLNAAKLMGAKGTDKASESSAGSLLVDRILDIMQQLKIPNGLKAIGYTEKDITKLVEGTIPQHRVTKLSPKPVGREELTALFHDSMTVY